MNYCDKFQKFLQEWSDVIEREFPNSTIYDYCLPEVDEAGCAADLNYTGTDHPLIWYFHTPSIAIECYDDTCDIESDILSYKDYSYEIERLLRSINECKIESVHEHFSEEAPSGKEIHFHIVCKNILLNDVTETIKKLLRITKYSTERALELGGW